MESTTGSLQGSFTLRGLFGIKQTRQDSIVHQISKANYSQRFYGYNEWLKIFPNLFNHSFTSRSHWTQSDEKYFQTEVYPYINNTDEKVFWIHTESIDEAYHHNKAQVPAAIKLITKKILEIYKIMDEHTLFLIYGDHGCVESNRKQHGGKTAEELGTALMIVSKKPLALNKLGYQEQTLSKYEELLLSYLPTFKHNEIIKENNDIFFGSAQKSPFNNIPLYLIDLPSTLSYLLDLPIPHNSLGKLIPEVMEYSKGTTITGLLIQILFEHTLTLLQINNLLKEYVNSGVIGSRSQHIRLFRTRLKSLRGNLAHLFNSGEKFINLETEHILKESQMLDHELVSYISQIIDGISKIDNLIRENAEYFRNSWLGQDYNMLLISYFVICVVAAMLTIWSLSIYIWRLKDINEETYLSLSTFPKPLLFGKFGIALLLLIFIFLIHIFGLLKIAIIFLGCIFSFCFIILTLRLIPKISHIFPLNTKIVFSLVIFVLVAVLKIAMPSTTSIYIIYIYIYR